MDPITIDENKCITCSLCVNDCPNSYLFLHDQRILTNDKGCMECGHCYAICPQRAVDMVNYNCINEKIVPMTEMDSDILLNAMRSRRTIRKFKSEEVEQEKLIRFSKQEDTVLPVEIHKMFHIQLGSRQDEAEEICVNLFRKGKKMGSPFVSYLKRIDITDNFFFKGAPLVIIVSAKSSVDSGLASSYMEIMAENLGLGVLYSGFFVMCTKISRKLKNLLELESGHDVVTCMVIGYPNVTYQRIVPRKELKVKKL